MPSTYDDFGNITKISADGNTLVTNIYAEKNGNLTDSFYGNQDCVRYIYDNLDRITQMRYNDNTGASAIFKYTYNANGDLSSHTDSINGETHVYTYDAKGNIAQRIVKNTTSNTVKRVEQYTYDRQGRVASVDYSYVNTTDVPTLVHYDYEYDVTGNVTNAKYIGTPTQTAYTYDAFGRLETEVFQNASGSNRYFDRMYLYSTNSGATSNQIEWAMMSSYDGKSYDTYYEYDDVGNIVLIEVTDQNNNIILQYNYHYDDKSQLIREDLYYGSGNSSNRTMVYTYDKAGNILSKKKYAYINPASSVSGTPITYSYGYEDAWGDRLTSYNGKSLTYDEIGNPLTYGTYSYEWKFGRQLASISNSSTGLSVSYQYNDEGIRTVKIVNGVRHEYDVIGGQINREVIRSSSSATSAVMKDIRYYYDAAGRPVAIRAFTRTSSSADFTDTIYYLQTNLQGDVVGIYNASGTKIYEYAYDAWGNIIKSAQVATGGSDAHAVNPFRYRGYYYDTETGLYYLQSRYYNPEWGRFLNADVYLSTGTGLLGYNMYSYCDNNPVMRTDYSGTNWFSDTWKKVKEFFSNIGATVNIGKERSDEVWLGLITIETGEGYSKSFDTGKSANVYASTGEKWFELDEYSAGLDVNINGYGANIEIGADSSWGIHMGGTSIDFGSSLFGRSYIQITRETESGAYAYTKISLNKYECAGVILIAIYAPYVLPALLPASLPAFAGV